MNRKHLIIAFFATTVIGMTVVAYAMSRQREESHAPYVISVPDQTEENTHETPPPTIVTPPEVPDSLNVPANHGMMRVVDKALLYSIEVPSEWIITSSKGSDELPWGHYSYVSGNSDDYHYDVSAEVMDNPSTPIDRGMVFNVDAYKNDSCTSAPDQETALSRVRAQDVFPYAEASVSKTAWEMAHPHEVKKLDATFKHTDVCITVTALYNSKEYPNGEDVFKKILKSFRFEK